jgi:hypothetical protein
MATVHGCGQGPTVWGAQQGGHGLQEAHRDAWHLRVPLADTGQLLAKCLLQREAQGTQARAWPAWVRTQREDLEWQGRYQWSRSRQLSSPSTSS